MMPKPAWTDPMFARLRDLLSQAEEQIDAILGGQETPQDALSVLTVILRQGTDFQQGLWTRQERLEEAIESPETLCPGSHHESRPLTQHEIEAAVQAGRFCKGLQAPR
jgi:hypothetical protein